MRFANLEGWLDWQESLHPDGMELGLERCREVLARLLWGELPFPVVTVAGTNGKGSTVAFIESILRAGGLRTGTYTSPHLVRYNERICIDGEASADTAISESFERLDRARGDLLLTYFEFGTLAAVDLFRRRAVDVAIMEVGIGGRLDAVNVFDPSVSVVAPIDIDHVKWLGGTRESIGEEKAGILRHGVPAVISDPSPPESLLMRARRIGAPVWRLGAEFSACRAAGAWVWRGPGGERLRLPVPGDLRTFPGR